MNGAGTVSATSPRRNFRSAAMKARIVNHASAAARLIRAAFAGHPVPDLDDDRALRSRRRADADPAFPRAPGPAALPRRCSAIAAMIAAVVLGSGG